MDRYKFEMHGAAFDGSDRLDKVAAGLTALQHMFEGQYRAFTNRKRLNEEDRRNLQIRIDSYADGSFIAVLGAAFAGVQITLPLFSGSASIWELSKSAFDFIKATYEAAHSGKEIQISQSGDGNTVLLAGASQQIFYGPVLNIANQIISPMREFDTLLEDKEVSKIALSDPEGEAIFAITSEMKGLFLSPTSVSEHPINLTCDIFDFNKYDKAGRARVLSNQEIPLGNYKFKNVGDQGVDDFILSMTETQVTLKCIIKYEHDPLSETKISEILVLGIAP